MTHGNAMCLGKLARPLVKAGRRTKPEAWKKFRMVDVVAGRVAMDMNLQSIHDIMYSEETREYLILSHEGRRDKIHKAQ